MTLWLAAAIVGLLVVMGPRPAATRLARSSISAPRVAGAQPTTHARDLAVAAVIGSALVALRLPIVLAAAGGLLPLGWAKLRHVRRRNLTHDARRAAVAEATFALAGELRAGRTASEALRAAATNAGPLADVFRTAAETVAVGGSAAAELEAASQLPGAERLRFVAAAWRVTESAGGRVALVLERLGEAMDRDDEVSRELESAVAAPRASMMLLAALPAFGLVLGQSIGAHPIHFLLYRPLGWALLLGAGILDAIGIVISQQITRWALRC